MATDEIPQELMGQLTPPSGQFPGTAQTLATPVGSDTPVRVNIGQSNNPALSLSKREYRERAAQQNEIDIQADASATLEQPPNPPSPKKRGRAKGSKNKPKPVAAPEDTLIGRPYPATSTTEAPPPIPIPTDAMLEARMARIERGMNMIVGAIAKRDELYRVQDESGLKIAPPDDGYSSTAITDIPAQDAAEAFAELDEEFEEDEDEDEVDDAPEPGQSSDKPPVQVEDDAGWDKGLEELQQMIQKRNPQKLFRQYWCQLSRAAQYNEWPPERREAFDESFNQIVTHPKFVHQMSTFMRGSRSGNCIGNEQIARVCGMVAGFLTVYQLAAAGK